MWFKPFVVLMLVLSFSLADGSDPPKDGDTLQGTWLPAAAELAGNKFPDEVRKTIKLVVKDDKYTVTVGKQVNQGTVKLNSGGEAEGNRHYRHRRPKQGQGHPRHLRAGRRYVAGLL